MAFCPQPKPESRVSIKKERQQKDYWKQRDTYAAVDQRDKGRCRVCGRYCTVKALALLERAHRHHVIYRSAGGPDETWNVATLCAGCHAQQHGGLIDVRGNADEGLEIWKNGADGWYMDRREVRPHQTERD